MKLAVPLSLAAALAACPLLAACSSGKPSAAEEAAAANRVDAYAEEHEADARMRGLPKGDSPRPSVAAKQLSPAFQGRWGMTPNDCDFSRSDTKGLVTVYADKLSFYESTAKIDALTKHSQTRVSAELTFTGEGQTWKRRDELELISAGTMLVRKEQSTTYRYERC